MRKSGDIVRLRCGLTFFSSNGKTSGITQPSILGQEEVIRKAYKKAGLNPRDTAYVECHGTGTGVGDPMEVEALSKFFPRDRPTPLLLGAVSTFDGFPIHGLAKDLKRTKRISVTAKQQVEYQRSSRLC